MDIVLDSSSSITCKCVQSILRSPSVGSEGQLHQELVMSDDALDRDRSGIVGGGGNGWVGSWGEGEDGWVGSGDGRR